MAGGFGQALAVGCEGQEAAAFGQVVGGGEVEGVEGADGDGEGVECSRQDDQGELDQHEARLVRGLEEELGIVTQPPCQAPLSFASHAYPTFHLLMPLFVCRVWEGEPAPREGQAIRCLRPKQPFSLPMPEADRPLLRFLDELL